MAFFREISVDLFKFGNMQTSPSAQAASSRNGDRHCLWEENYVSVCVVDVNGINGASVNYGPGVLIVHSV